MLQSKILVEKSFFGVLTLLALFGCSHHNNMLTPSQITTESEVYASQQRITLTNDFPALISTKVNSPTPSFSQTQTKDTKPTNYMLPLLSGRIAFVLSGDGTDNIFIVDIHDNSIIGPLTSEGVFNLYPAWSPNGEEIAFASDRAGIRGSFFDIFTMSVNGDNVQRLTSYESKWDKQPTWSPDGLSIAFTHYYLDALMNSDIFVMDYSGKNQFSITNTELPEEYPTWSPTGDTIAFLYQENEKIGKQFVYLMNVDGTNRRKLSNVEAAGKITWSPDGHQLAFSATRDIYLVNVDGSGGHYLIGEDDYYLYSPTWSPDGEYIAFKNPNDDLSISVADLSGRIVETIFINPEFGWQVLDIAWSPE